MRDILVNYWHPVEEASKISNVPLPITLLGERLVIYMHMNEEKRIYMHK